MWLWRAGRQKRWSVAGPPTPENLVEAAIDLEVQEPEGLSLFQVADLIEAEQVAVLFGMTSRRKPDPVDYLLIPPECFAPLAGVQLVHDPVNYLPPFLAERHYEARGMTRTLGTTLAGLIFAHPDHQVIRISKAELVQRASAVLQRDPSVESYLRDQWRKILKVDSP